MTVALADKTNKLMEMIDDKMDTMNAELSKVKEDVAKVLPYNKDQIELLNRIQASIAHVTKMIESADEQMELHDKT